MTERRRRAVSLTWLVVALLAATGVVAAIASDDLFDGTPASRPAGLPEDPADRLRQVATGLNPGDDYRPPTAAERKKAIAGLSALVNRGGTDDLTALGFSVTSGKDPVTGRDYTLALNEPDGERAWGAYLVDTSAQPALAVEVPHPNSDLRTEEIGMDLFRQVPGAVLLMSGTHRRVNNGEGDVAHREDSLFHAFAGELTDRGVPQVQLHGFHDDSLEGTDIVLSPGPGDATTAVRRVANRLADAGFSVCRSWDEKCGKLEGTRNQQGKQAAKADTLFLHVEISRTVRDDRERWATLIRVLAEVR